MIRMGQLVGPVGGHQEEREVAGVALEEVEQLHRRTVCPLHVLEEEHHRRAGGESLEQLQHRVEDVERHGVHGRELVGVDQPSECLVARTGGPVPPIAPNR